MCGRSDGAATDGTDIAKIERPSAGCDSTSLAAIVVTPPGRFSTIVRQPSASDSSLAMMRLITSGGVLAEFGATKRMTPEAKLCCCACAAAPVRAQTSAATGASAVVNVGLIMGILLRV